MYTMRSAFLRWLYLHDESWRAKNHVKIPNWFRWYIRNNCKWEYHVNSNSRNYFNVSTNSKRAFKGFYHFNVTDEELINLQRAEWIK